MAKKDRNKKFSDRYKAEGRRERNKVKRQERAQRHIEKLKARAERRKSGEVVEVKNQEPKPLGFESWMKTEDWLSPEKRKRKTYRINKRINSVLDPDGRNYGWWQRKFARLDNELREIESNSKLIERKLKSNQGKATVETRREDANNA